MVEVGVVKWRTLVQNMARNIQVIVWNCWPVTYICDVLHKLLACELTVVTFSITV